MELVENPQASLGQPTLQDPLTIAGHVPVEIPRTRARK
jgi:hypothetical protein